MEKRLFYENAGGVPDTSQGSIAEREKVCDLVASLPSEASRYFCLKHDLEKKLIFIQNTSLVMLHDFGSSCLCYFTEKCHRFLFHLNSTLTTTICFAGGSTIIGMKSLLLWFQAQCSVEGELWCHSRATADFHWQELLWLALCTCDLPPEPAGKMLLLQLDTNEKGV